MLGVIINITANVRRFSIHPFKIIEVVMADGKHEFYSKAEDALTAHVNANDVESCKHRF
jgi:hypothetical protein